MSEAIEGQIRRFLLEEIAERERPSVITDDTPLLTGLLDSLALTQLLAFLEERFDVCIGSTDVRDANFGTLPRVASFVAARRRDQASQ